MVRAMETRCFWPVESLSQRLSAKGWLARGLAHEDGKADEVDDHAERVDNCHAEEHDPPRRALTRSDNTN